MTIILLGSMLFGCEHHEQKVSDAELQAIKAWAPGITDVCLDKIRRGGIEAMPERTDECVEMLPAQRWKGLWLREFEGSQFCAAPANDCVSTRQPEDAIWLDFSSSVPAQLKGMPTGGLYAIEFVGRKTKYHGHYGHMGVFGQEIIVDRLISMKEVQAPPQPTEAELESMRRQCAAIPKCRENADMMKALEGKK